MSNHYSDCAVHNGPAYPAGPCDCGGGETSEVPTRYRRGDRIERDGQILEFIEAEIEGEKWRVIGPALRPAEKEKGE